MTTFQERSRYHQIHPLKLFTDWSTGCLARYFFWAHGLVFAVAIALIPSIAVSLILLRFADLEKYRASTFGKYVNKYMTRVIEAARFLGYAVMAIGAWIRSLP